MLSAMSNRSESKSIVWQYFIRAEYVEAATCIQCGAVIQCKGSSTSGLLRHLKGAHNNTTTELGESKKRVREYSSTELGESKKRVREYSPVDIRLMKQRLLPEERLEEIVAKLAAVDGLSVNAIANSEFVRRMLADKGMIMPTDPNTIMNMVRKQYNTVKGIVVMEITKELGDGARFSVILDEYFNKYRRFLNVSVRQSPTKFWNLGLVRIPSGLPWNKCTERVETKLRNFNLELQKDTVACVSCSPQKAVEPQLCYAYGLHLAICDVLYHKMANLTVDEETNGADNSSYDSPDDDDGEEYTSTLDFSNRHYCLNHKTVHLADDLETVVEKVRETIRLFRKSRARNDTLQKYTKDEYNTEIQLKLDSKQKWSSLLDMLERFIALQKCILKALNEVKQSLDMSAQELSTISDVVSALQPIKIGIERLGRRDSTLLSAEGVLIFVLDSLKEQNTLFSSRIRQAILNRIKERRNPDLVGLLKYLNNSMSYELKSNSDLPLPAKLDLETTAEKLYSRLFGCDAEVKEENQLHETVILPDGLLVPFKQEPIPGSSFETIFLLEQKLNVAIENVTCPHSGEDQGNDVNNITKEMKVYEITGNRTENLNRLFETLLTIPPTSVEAQRAFSAPGMFVPKICTGLTDSTVDILWFLRNYFLSKSATLLKGDTAHVEVDLLPTTLEVGWVPSS